MGRPLPVAKLSALAAMAASSAIVGTVAGGVSGALLGMLSGVAQNLFSGLFQRRLEHDPPSPESLILNRDLRRLTGEAIAAVILTGEPDAEQAERGNIRRLAESAKQQWNSEAAAADTRLAAMAEDQLITFFKTSSAEFTDQRALDVATWRSFLESVDPTSGDQLKPEILDRMAILLHEHLPQVLRGKVKQDFEGETEAEGRGFASLHLIMMGSMLQKLDSLLALAEVEDRDAASAKAIATTVGKKTTQHQARLTAGERTTLARLIEQVNTIRPVIDRRINDVLRAIAEGDKRSEERSRFQARRLHAIAAGVATIGIILLIAIWRFGTSHEKQLELTERVADESALISREVSKIGPEVGQKVDYRRPLDEAAVRTIVAAEWRRWHSEELLNHSLDDLRAEIGGLFEAWRSQYGDFTANAIKERLYRALAFCEGGDYRYRILNARLDRQQHPDFDAEDTPEKVELEIKISGSNGAKLVGKRQPDGTFHFEKSEAILSWRPGQSITLFAGAETRSDRELRAEHEQELKDYERERREYEEAKRRWRTDKSLDMPISPSPPSPIPPNLAYGFIGFDSHGAIAISHSTACATLGEDRLAGTFNEVGVICSVELVRADKKQAK